MEKYLYFRSVTDEANDGVTGLKTNNPSSFLFPASTLTAMQPTADTTLTLYFEPAIAKANGGLRDKVDLTVVAGDTFEVMSAISDAIANPSRGHSDGYITVCDAVTTTDSATSALNDLTIAGTFIHSSVTACAITVQPAAAYGVFEHYEVVDIDTSGTADDAVCGALSVYIPAQATIVEGSITAVELAGNDVGSVALEVHTAVDTGASAGTEIIGADEGSNLSLPDADLDISSNAILGDTITGGTLISHESPLDRGTNASYFHLVAKEDMDTTDPTGTPKVGVYLKWYGPAAIAL
tara:strand:- start:470 stop:1354 length:885 start_codon:yes stop_codon:yes gene_type:complete